MEKFFFTKDTNRGRYPYYNGVFLELPESVDGEPLPMGEIVNTLKMRVCLKPPLVMVKALRYPHDIIAFTNPVKNPPRFNPEWNSRVAGVYDNNPDILVTPEIHKLAVRITIPDIEKVQKFALKELFTWNYKVYEGSLYPLVEYREE